MKITKTTQTCFERFWSTSAAKKRFEAKLRRIRWRIYQKIHFKRKRLKRIFDYYSKQVSFYLKQFSLKLKPKETSIWSEKLTKTSNDVLTYLKDAQNVGKTSVIAQPCFECSNKLDSLLFMLSAVLHLVRTDQAKATTVQTAATTTIDAAVQSVELGGSNADEKAAKTTIDAAVQSEELGGKNTKEKAATTTIDTAVQSEELDGNNAKESKCNIGEITTASSEVVKAPTNHYDHVDLVYDPRNGLRNAVYNDREEHLRRVREASNKYLASCKLGQDRTRIAGVSNPIGVESGDDIIAPAEKNMKESEAVVNVLDDKTTSAANVIMSEKEEFRKRAWAIYNAPSKPDPFRFWPIRRL